MACTLFADAKYFCHGFLGYVGDTQATTSTIDEHGFLHTGDIGLIDDDDEVFIVDRVKEIIKFKGFQVKFPSISHLYYGLSQLFYNLFFFALLCLIYHRFPLQSWRPFYYLIHRSSMLLAFRKYIIYTLEI